MRYAIVSDIHGNLPAWKTVLSDISLRHVDRIICLGDVVGYGPQPAECLSSVYAHAAAMILGNHDAVVAGLLSSDVFNDRAQRVIEWTKAQLGEKAQTVFSKLPLVLKGPTFRCTHGDFTEPAVFRYIHTPEEAAASFAVCPEQLLFCGHTHRTALFLIGESGVVHHVEAQDFELEDGKRYLVNPGSVGSSREQNPRASYVIYDEDRRAVYFHRVTYDLQAFRDAVSAADGLAPEDVQLLRSTVVQAAESASAREEIDFTPSGGQRVENHAGPAVSDLSEQLRKSKRKTKIALFTAMAAVAIALLAGIFLFLRGEGSYSAAFPKEDYPAIAKNSDQAGFDGNVLPPFSSARMTGDIFECEPYRVVLGDTRHQRIALDDSSGRPMLISDPVLIRGNGGTVSAQPSEISFSSPLLAGFARERVKIMARARFSEDFQGSFTLLLIEADGNGVEKTLFERNFSASMVGISEKNLPDVLQACPAREGWKLAHGTSSEPVPPNSRGVRVVLRGRFTGSVIIGAISARNSNFDKKR